MPVILIIKYPTANASASAIKLMLTPLECQPKYNLINPARQTSIPAMLTNICGLFATRKLQAK